MAFQMEYTDSADNLYTASYWRLVQINLDNAEKTGTVTFYAYKDASARNAGKSPIARKSYAINAQLFAIFYAHDALNPEGKNPQLASYEMALASLEGPTPQEGENDTRMSFFSSAIVV